MKSPRTPKKVPILITVLLGCVLSACGGSADSSLGAEASVQGAASGAQAPSAQQLLAEAGTQESAEALLAYGRKVRTPKTPLDTVPDTTTGTTTNSNTTTSPVVTKVEIQNTSTSTTAQTNIPVTFGQVFHPGDIPSGNAVSVTRSDGTQVAYQLDVKARHADGSLRHGIFSVVLPRLDPAKTESLSLAKAAPITGTAAITPAVLLNSGFTSSVNVNIAGKQYTASADALLSAGKYTTWLSGPVTGEWLVSAPLKATDGTEHPHLNARFAIRAFGAGIDKARVDVTIENNWAYEPAPQNFTYDVQVLVGGTSVYSKTALTHYHHARWRKTFWWGAAPDVHVKHDSAYLIASKALPNYDTRIVISATGLNNLDQKWKTASTGPMDPGIVTTAMGMAGGRPDIGPLPQWAAAYLLSMDRRAKTVTLGVGDLAGSWPIHYRDKKTDRPVSLIDYPYMTLLGRTGDTVNPATGKSEQFPACSADCTTTPHNYKPDGNHQPSMAYLPYVVTGDHYYLEELQFWANWNMVQANPYYRDFDKGVTKWNEVRGQAWTLRTLGQIAYITPDNDPMKKYFVDRVSYNLAFYNTTYVTDNPNQLGVIDGTGKYAFQSIIYSTPSGASTGVAPWQDDFFTWSVGYLVELGFVDAKPLLAWKAKFPVARMTAPGYCWIDGAAYTLTVRPNSTSPLFSTFGEAYRATMRNADGTAMVNSTGARYLDQACGSQAQADWRTQFDKDSNVTRNPWQAGEMTGYATYVMGYPSNMQPALAVAATSGIPNASTAWNIFINRSVKPDYSSEPQWAIVPRN